MKRWKAKVKAHVIAYAAAEALVLDRVENALRAAGVLIYPAGRSGHLQLAYLRDILQSYHAYLKDDWSKAVISSAMQAASPENPILKEYFR